jgi:hypothetical protein
MDAELSYMKAGDLTALYIVQTHGVKTGYSTGEILTALEALIGEQEAQAAIELVRGTMSAI